MTVKEMMLPRQLFITINKIWQRPSSQSYAAYLRRNQQGLRCKVLNQVNALLVMLTTTLLFIAVAELAWLQVSQLGH